MLILGLASGRHPSGFGGEWIGDLGQGTTERLEVVIDSAGGGGRVNLRSWGLRDVVARSIPIGRDSFGLAAVVEGDTVSFRGRIGEGTWTGEAVRGADRRPFELRRFEVLSDSAWTQLVGTYRAEDGRLLGVIRWAEFGPRPLVVDYQAGRIGPLYPLRRDRFLVGGSVVSPVFPADTLEVKFEPNSTVGRIRLVERGHTPVTGRRLTTRDEEVRFTDGDVTLAGTLTLPEGPGPYPALVLVHGSNAQPREGFGPWTRYFAGLGYAVLAFDKRGTGRSTGDWREVGFGPLAGDVLAGSRLLATRKDIRADKIGIWAISQAGWIAPLAISQAPKEFAFLVVHSGTGTTPLEQGRLNLRYELQFRGAPESEIATALQYLELNDSVTRTGKGWDRLQAFYESHRSEPNRLWRPQPLDFWRRAYYRKFMDFDPRSSWETVRCPVLLLFGELDANVPPKESRPPIEEALRRAGNRSVTVKVFPKANHVLFAAETGAESEYPSRSRFAPGYFETMGTWLAANAR